MKHPNHRENEAEVDEMWRHESSIVSAPSPQSSPRNHHGSPDPSVSSSSRDVLAKSQSTPYLPSILRHEGQNEYPIKAGKQVVIVHQGPQLNTAMGSMSTLQHESLRDDT